MTQLQLQCPAATLKVKQTICRSWEITLASHKCLSVFRQAARAACQLPEELKPL